MFERKKLVNSENIMKIRIKNISWLELFKDKEVLYGAICDLLLNDENLLYYATQKESSKTISDTKNYVKSLKENNSLIYAIEDIFNALGWNKDLNIDNTTFQGDLAEYLMSILLDKITNIDTLISKISYKTSTSMSVFGNDNIYFDYETDTLYFGESKFYMKASTGLRAAIGSVNKHANVEEISFVRNHTSSFIAENGQKRLKVIEKFETAYGSDLNIKSVVFVINEDIYEKKDYEQTIINFYGSKEDVSIKTSEVILVFLPILSKREFLNYFVRRVEDVKN